MDWIRNGSMGGFTSTNSNNWAPSPQSKGARYNPATNTWFNLIDPPVHFMQEK